MPVPEPYRKLGRFVKKDWAKFGHMIVANIVFLMAYQLASLALVVPILVLVLILQLSIFPLLVLSGGICAIILVPILLLIPVFMIAIMILAISCIQGWNVYLARKVLDTKKGLNVDLKAMLGEIRSEWKHYLRKGFGISAFYFLVLTPLILVVILLPMVVLISAGSYLMFDHPTLGLLLILASFLFYIFSIVLLMPAIQFVVDSGSLRIAQGQGAWMGMIGGMRDIFKRRRLFGYYYISMLIISVVLVFLSPIAMLIQWALPVMTKAFIVSNDDL